MRVKMDFDEILVNEYSSCEIRVATNYIKINLYPHQHYKNVTIIPLSVNYNKRLNLLSLEKGLDMGIVEVTECKEAIVESVNVINNAISPLLLIDGDEILGSKQNRIISRSVIVPPESVLEVPVNCSEKNRWEYSSKKFSYSPYFANFNTRRVKADKSYNAQSKIWDSIDQMFTDYDLKSPTAALSDNYESLKINQDEYLKNFNIVKGQNGLITVINDEIVGFELFYNESLYKRYHEKLLRSYVIDALKDNDSGNCIMEEDIINYLKSIENTTFTYAEELGFGKSLNFTNDYGAGSVLFFDDELIHMSYFKHPEGYTHEKINYL